jgi:hypothetical protein
MADYTKIDKEVDAQADSLCESDAPYGGHLKDRYHYECVIHAAVEHFGIKEAP